MTAQKRDQNLQDVPLAIVALGGDQLENSGIVSAQDLKVGFAGVNIRSTSSYFQPSIRGVSTSGINVENPVALYVDGVYYASQRDANRDLEDIEQIAVLKGPQGTLFGRNATGGVIQITTKAPSQNAQGNAAISIDNYATVRASAYLTGPLAPDLSASVAGSFVTQGDGWGQNLTTGRDIFKINHHASVRGKLLFEPSADTSILVIGDYMDRKNSLGAYFRPFPGTRAAIAGFIAPNDVHDAAVDGEARSLFKGGGVSATLEHQLGFAKLTSISAYRANHTGYTLDADMVPTLNFNVRQRVRHSTFTQEMQLSSDGEDDFNWTVGAFYYFSDYRVDPIINFLGGVFAPLPTSNVIQTTFGKEIAQSIAPFGQVDFTIAPRTHLTLGIRWTYEERVFDATRIAVRADGTVVPAVIPPINDAKVTARKPTWRIALDHNFSDDVLAYASYNRGFKSGGFNAANPLNPSYEPEQLDAYEVGLKTVLADSRMRLNLAGFYYTYKNIQVLQFINRANTIVNGASAELYGLDVDFEAQISRGLRLTGGLALLKASFISFPNAGISSPLPAGGVTIVTGSATGNRLPLSQKYNGNIGLSYTTDASFGELEFGAIASFNGKYFFESDNFTFQEPQQLVNLTASWTSLDDGVTVGVFVRNLLDEKIISQASALSGIGYVTTYDNPPRVFGGSVRVRF